MKEGHPDFYIVFENSQWYIDVIRTGIENVCSCELNLDIESTRRDVNVMLDRSRVKVDKDSCGAKSLIGPRDRAGLSQE